MLTEGSLSLICEQLTNNGKVVASFAGLTKNIPNHAYAYHFCQEVPYLSTNNIYIIMLYGLIELGADLSPFGMIDIGPFTMFRFGYDPTKMYVINNQGSMILDIEDVIEVLKKWAISKEKIITVS